MAKTNKQTKSSEQDNLLLLTHTVLVNERCTYSYSVRLENGESDDIITNECGRQYHNDLRTAFRLFDGHLAVLTEQVDADLVKDIDQCEGVNSNVSDKLLQLQVSEVKINGNIKTGSVTLAGIKILRSKEEIKLKTPKTELYSDYEFINELVAATQNLIHEITEYHNGKSRPESQLDMFTQADNLEVTK